MDLQFLTQQTLRNIASLQIPQPFGSQIPLHPQLSSQLAAYQAMLLQNRALQMAQLQSVHLQNAQRFFPMKQDQPVKVEPSLLSGSPNALPLAVSHSQSLSPQSSNTETTPSSVEKSSEKDKISEKVVSNTYSKAELKKMISFLLTNMGKAGQEQIDNERNQYLNSPCLLQLYDKLVMKYYCAKKCREDIVRYIIRRVFKLLKASLMKEEKVSGKKATQLLCKRYFSSNFERIEKSGINVNNEDELMEFFLPYNKKSKNRTMNTTFMIEIFSSEGFCKEYQKFLERFDDILAEDNEKKMDKFLSFLDTSIKKNDLTKLGSFNRLPWLDIWMEDTKNIAIGLMRNKDRVSELKKLKNE